MKTIVVTLDKEHPDGEAILRAGEIIKAGGPKAVPQAMAEFNRLPFAYREAAAAAASLQTSGTRSAVDVAEVCRKWNGEARKQYLKAASLAKEGK